MELTDSCIKIADTAGGNERICCVYLCRVRHATLADSCKVHRIKLIYS